MKSEPSRASTVVLLREGGASRPGGPGCEVFFVRRHAKSAFMANAYVFPGGRVDEADAAPELVDRVEGVSLSALATRMGAGVDQETAAAHLVAAIREAFEEAGVLFARRRGAADLIPTTAAFGDWRERLNRKQQSFAEMVAAEDLVLAGGELVYFAHWVTPVVEKHRYDARFFVARAPAGQHLEHDHGETTDSLWLAPSQALRRHDALALQLAPPTWRTLRELLPQEASLDAVRAWAEGLSVERRQPHLAQQDGSFVLALPGDPLYPGGTGSPATNRVVLREGRWRPN
jgi:8-oxo-dGTP pyrophosphatase MutT (NUDIX family)